MRILIVEDNRNLARGLRHNLELEGYTVDVAYDGTTGLSQARGDVDLVILDLMIPKPDGIQILRTLREEGVDTPVLVLTALGTEADKLRGFRVGADDYLVKPFRVLELIARAEAILRRRGPGVPSRVLPRRQASLERARAPLVAFGNVRIDPDARAVYRDDVPVALRPREYDLLLALVQRRGAVASRFTLLNEVWGADHDVVRRTVDTHIWELRRKLEYDPTRPKHIVTVRKAGYRLQP